MIVNFLNRLQVSNLIRNQISFNLFRYASQSSKTEAEIKLNDVLKNRFPNARLVDVKDTSGKYII